SIYSNLNSFGCPVVFDVCSKIARGSDILARTPTAASRGLGARPPGILGQAGATEAVRAPPLPWRGRSPRIAARTWAQAANLGSRAFTSQARRGVPRHDILYATGF